MLDRNKVDKYFILYIYECTEKFLNQSRNISKNIQADLRKFIQFENFSAHPPITHITNAYTECMLSAFLNV